MFRRVPAAVRTLVLWASILSATVGCSGAVGARQVKIAEGALQGVEVSGPVQVAPTVRIAAPLTVTTTGTEVVSAGSGPPVQADQLFVLNLTMYDARTGRPALSTYDPGQHAMAVKTTDGSLFPRLVQALLGQRQGSRVVLALAGQDAYGDAGNPQLGIEPGDPLVLVADVSATLPASVLPGAVGTPEPAGVGTPRVLTQGAVPMGVDTAGHAEPDTLVVVPLIRGAGPAVRPDSLVTVDELGQVWGVRVPFEDTFFKEPLTVALLPGAVVPAWEQALVGVPRGSRLLVLAPARLAYGDGPRPADVPAHATIAWVIDVVGVS